MEEVINYIQDLVTTYFYKKLPDDLSTTSKAYYEEMIPIWIKDTKGPVALQTLAASIKVAKKYNRVVIGDYGAYIEIDEKDMLKDNLIIAPGQEYRLKKPYCDNVKYLWMTAKNDHSIKIYYQLRGVSYADYKPEKYYVSVYEVYPLTV